MKPGSHHMVRVNDLELACFIIGQGPPVIFLHGGGATDYRTWEAQFDPFSSNYRVIAYSRRGHFPNIKNLDDRLISSTLAHASDLEKMIMELKLGPSNLVASSSGADIALWLAVKSPAMVKSLVLEEPALHPWLVTLPGGAQLYAQYRMPMDDAARAVREGNIIQGARIFIEAASGTGAFDRLSDNARSRLMDNIDLISHWEADAYDPGTAISREEAKGIFQPVLLITGENTIDKYRLINAELRRILPHSEWYSIPGAAHLPHLQNSTAFNKVVLAFLNTITTKGLRL